MKLVALLMLVSAPASLLAVSSSRALTYECTDAAGRVIFTDSPSQLKSCAPAVPARSEGGPPHPLLLPGVEKDGIPHPPPVLQGERVGGEGVAVPVTKIGQSLVVQARLNGTRDVRLIVDTGAELTVLSHAVALEAGLLPSQSLAAVTLNTAGGSVRAHVFRVGLVSLGEAEARDVAAAVHDLSDAPTGVDGLLGLTFLDRFLVTLDAQKGELHLKQRQ